MKLKLRAKREGVHVKVDFFAGKGDNYTLANLGMLTCEIGEYQLLAAAILLGAERTQGQLKVEIDEVLT